MNADLPLSFVDTNILAYAFDKSLTPKKQVAQHLLDELMAGDALRVSTQVLQELFVTLTRKVSRPCSTHDALALLEALTAWPLLVVDYSIIRGAAKLGDKARLSFRDALIVESAARSGATILYTEDLNHGQLILGVRITNPFAVLKP